MEGRQIEALIATAIQAAIDASRVLMEHLEKHNEALVIRAKCDGSPVSAADMASNH